MAEQIPNLTPVTSTHLAAVGYDEGQQALYVEWKDGRVSKYDDVPATVASDFQSASSPGKAFNDYIRSQYTHKYVKE